jgi:hypothetical protein
MQKSVAIVLSVVAAISGWVWIAAAQDRPGMPTQARVWIENRRADEAVPVTMVQRPSDSPHRVELVGAASAIVRTRRAPDAWDYQTIVVPANQQAATALEPLGREGWEVTGVQFPASNGAVLLLKRPR